MSQDWTLRVRGLFICWVGGFNVKGTKKWESVDEKGCKYRLKIKNLWFTPTQSLNSLGPMHPSRLKQLHKSHESSHMWSKSPYQTPNIQLSCFLSFLSSPPYLSTPPVLWPPPFVPESSPPATSTSPSPPRQGHSAPPTPGSRRGWPRAATRPAASQGDRTRGVAAFSRHWRGWGRKARLVASIGVEID